MIRIVVVDDSAESVSAIERLLYFEPDIEVVGTANDGETGVQLVRELRPDIVLLDVNMHGMDGLAAAEAITSTVPGTQVIMMSVEDDLEYLRRAMMAGARDYILKPLDMEELPAKIRQVYSAARAKLAALAAPEPHVNGTLVVIFSPKGGSGCTTVTVNLAIALRDFTKRKVVVVDGCLQFGDVAVLLNLHDQRNIGELARHAEELDLAFVQEMTVSHASGVRTLLAPPRPEAAELVTAEAMRSILKALKGGYDFVVLDAGHALNELVLAALDEADQLVLLVTPEIAAVKSARLVLDVLDALNYPEEKRLLVVSQAGRRCGLKVEDIERSLRARVQVRIPWDEAGPLLAANQGRPLYEADPEAPMARSFLELAKAITGAAASGKEQQRAAAAEQRPRARRIPSLWGR
jgi:pilus assembly protein CpaE